MPIDNLIQRADLNQRLTRALEIKGQKSPVLQLDNSIVGVVMVEDLTKQAEYTQPEGRKVGFSAHQIGVAGQFSIGTIYNPPSSGVVLVMEYAFARASSTTEVLAGFADPLALPPTVQVPIYWDNRNSGVSPVQCRTGTDAAIRIVTRAYSYNTGTTTVGIPEFPPMRNIVINQGQAFGVQLATVAFDAGITIWWEEFAV
jgi:hypothetical protein